MMFDRTRGIVAAAAANDGRAGELGRPIGARWSAPRRRWRDQRLSTLGQLRWRCG